MSNTTTLTPFVLGDLRERMSDEDINNSTIARLFEEWLSFNGIIGYSKEIRYVLFDLITSSTPHLQTTDQEDTKRLQTLFELSDDDINLHKQFITKR